MQTDSPLPFGYQGKDVLPAFFVAPPGSTSGAMPSGAMRRWQSTRPPDFPDQQSFIHTRPFDAEAGNAAAVHERSVAGNVVLFGISPTFRGQWRSTFGLLLNALYIGGTPSSDGGRS